MKIIDAIKNKIDVYRFMAVETCSGIFEKNGEKVPYSTPKVCAAKVREISSAGDILYSTVDIFRASPSFDINDIDENTFFIPYFDKYTRLTTFEPLEK